MRSDGGLRAPSLSALQHYRDKSKTMTDGSELRMEFEGMQVDRSSIAEYLGEEAAAAYEARIETIKVNQEDVELQSKEILAAMQEIDSRVFTHRFYHEAPNDVFEIIFPLFSSADEDDAGNGGLNVLRLVSKRCMRVVESVATRLTEMKGNTDSLPLSTLKKCTRIKHVRCRYLISLEGCPVGLKSLVVLTGESSESLESLSACKELETLEIRDASRITSISPLSSCTKLKKLILQRTRLTDITPVSSMPLLEELDIWKAGGPFVCDLTPLSSCKGLRRLVIGNNLEIQDLSPLSHCPDLEELNMYGLTLIRDLSFLAKGFTKLRVLNISYIQTGDLSPLMKLPNLEELSCKMTSTTVSFLPLSRCYKLKSLSCLGNSKDLVELKNIMPKLEIDAY